MRFEGKVAIVSGGGTGIGAATAARLAEEGASVTITGRRKDALDEVAGATGALPLPGDTASPDDVEAAVAATLERFGGLDVVIANAGLGFGGGAGELSDEHWARTLDVNLTGAMLLVRAALPHLVRRGRGAVVFVASVSGVVTSPRSTAYEVSKAGMLALMRSVALDYGPLGVRSNAVLPGWIRTPMGDRAVGSLADERGLSLGDAYDAIHGSVPLRREGTPEEVASCCAFLASDDAAYVNGASLVVDGGGIVVDVSTTAWTSPTAEEATR
jgi:meso-butanediol dehydrogenase / (S,S)-butanediol dehydrogenase / diacetyl reductase